MEYNLSFRKGTPVAKYGKKTIRICEKKDDSFEQDDILDLLDDIDISSLITKKLRSADVNQLREALSDEIEPENEDLLPLYKKLLEIIRNRKNKELTCTNDSFKLLPNPKTRDVVYIGGRSGSGKSYQVAEYVKRFKKMFDEAEVFLFSPIKGEKVFKDLDIKQIDLDTIGEDKIDISQFPEGCLVIFDDIDSILDKNAKERISELMHQILQIGRHTKTYTVITKHLLNDYSKTRNICNEFTRVILFPAGSSHKNLTYFLEKYVGLDKHQIEKVLGMKSRHVIISSTVPMFAMCPNKIYLL